LEDDSINPLDLEFLYNGGGVGMGDFNGDGLQDLYFTGSRVANRLYLNTGQFHFKDVTAEAGVDGGGRWCNGVTVIDINNDGWPDLYVCATLGTAARRANLLYINQGPGTDGVPVFKEMAAAYHLADTGHSVLGAFLDYDHDGDLDMYLVETSPASRARTTFFGQNVADTVILNSDKLYRNDWDSVSRHPVFTDVSIQAGIRDDGYGLGVNIADFNRDGWPDIYVSNDFLTDDKLYINRRDGTFSDEAPRYFKHTSQDAMGNDVADINNDGWPDLVCLDMDPADNYRKKKNMVGDNYGYYRNMPQNGYLRQYVRNTLQINRGPIPSFGDSIKPLVFSDVAFMAGIAETDWSWTPSLADFDNDGLCDLIVTNGYPRDVTDHDFVAYRRDAGGLVAKQTLLAHIPSIEIANYAFRHTGGLHFEDVSRSWGFQQPSFSNGAVYGDLDNDGDLDYVVNNINGPAFVYENTLNDPGHPRHPYLRVRLKGGADNADAIGASVELYLGHGRYQSYYHTPSRGYLSSVDPVVHFGIPGKTALDSLVIRWADGSVRRLRGVAVDQTLTVRKSDTTEASEDRRPAGTPEVPVDPLFRQVTAEAGIRYRHTEHDFVDFNQQRLLPHKLSQYGPGLAVGDVDGNGLEDVFIGSSQGFSGQFLFQQPGGHFIEKSLTAVTDRDNAQVEDRGVLLFDADGDGDLDLYVAAGSVESPVGSKYYQDRIYENVGRGRFREDTAALPLNHTSKSAVVGADFDHDGDIDLFVGGRVNPGRYPEAVSSCLLRNDSRPGHIRFTDVTRSLAPALLNIGLISDALWSDFNNDGWADLVLAGEWTPLVFLENEAGHFKDITANTGIQKQTGWWRSLVAGDFDNDGDMDYLAGNLGLNAYFRADSLHPLGIYGGDFDGDGRYDAIPTLYLPDGHGVKKEFPAQGRDDLIRQMAQIKKQFPSYKAFATATITDILSPGELQGALILHAVNLRSCLVENLGQGHFRLKALPEQAQSAPVYGMVAGDFNGDGNLDVALVGNDFGAEPSLGRYDAFNGLILTGDGKGGFTPLSLQAGGFYVPGDGKALVKIILGKDHYGLLASQNQGPVQLFTLERPASVIPLEPGDQALQIHLKDGRMRRTECYYGSSFLAQSSRTFVKDSTMIDVEIINAEGGRRIVR
jgi:hypothetical protein